MAIGKPAASASWSENSHVAKVQLFNFGFFSRWIKIIYTDFSVVSLFFQLYNIPFFVAVCLPLVEVGNATAGPLAWCFTISWWLSTMPWLGESCWTQGVKIHPWKKQDEQSLKSLQTDGFGADVDECPFLMKRCSGSVWVVGHVLYVFFWFVYSIYSIHKTHRYLPAPRMPVESEYFLGLSIGDL